MFSCIIIIYSQKKNTLWNRVLFFFILKMRKLLLEKANTFKKSNEKKIKSVFSLPILSSPHISILLCSGSSGRYQERSEHSCWELRAERRSLTGSKGRPWDPQATGGERYSSTSVSTSPSCWFLWAIANWSISLFCFCNLLLSMVRSLSALKLQNKTHLPPAVTVDSMVLPSYLLGWACQRADSAHHPHTCSLAHRSRFELHPPLPRHCCCPGHQGSPTCQIEWTSRVSALLLRHFTLLAMASCWNPVLP